MPHQRIISVEGNDAARFLQAQLSRNVADLTPEQSRLAGWHDARGRVRAVFRVLAAGGGGYLLTAPTDLAEQLCAAMRMYVLRAAVEIDLTDLPCAGLAIAPGDAPASTAAEGLPEIPDAVITSGETTAICVAPGCWHFIGCAGEASDAPGTDTLPVDAAEIRAGLPRVDSRTTGKYVAHMLNLDSLGALDFEKGCFPGQEVVARTEHLGSVKRRARAFVIETADPAPQSGSALVDARGEQAGTVLRAARDTDGRVYLLAIVALDALESDFFLGPDTPAALERIVLPFE